MSSGKLKIRAYAQTASIGYNLSLTNIIVNVPDGAVGSGGQWWWSSALTGSLYVSAQRIDSSLNISTSKVNGTPAFLYFKPWNWGKPTWLGELYYVDITIDEDTKTHVYFRYLDITGVIQEIDITRINEVQEFNIDILFLDNPPKEITLNYTNTNEPIITDS